MGSKQLQRLWAGGGGGRGERALTVNLIPRIAIQGYAMAGI